VATKRTTKRRIKSPHLGVVLLRRQLVRGMSWQARWTDPDSGRVIRIQLSGENARNEDTRAAWAKKQSDALARRRMDLRSGVVAVVDPQSIDGAIDAYLTDARHRLRGRTIETYERGIELLKAWCAKRGMRRTTDLTPARLAQLRAYLIAKPRQNAVAEGRRGERAEDDARRSPGAINVELRAIKTLLNSWRLAGHLSVSKDSIGDVLKALPLSRERPQFLTPSQCQQLLEGCVRHDAAVFDETRKEHAGHGLKGTTPRYQPIAPFVVFVLLTGCRIGEALSLRWDVVDLDAVDNEGRKVGEIHLSAADVKTGRARTIGLEVSPELRRMLAGMKLRAGKNTHVFGGLNPMPRTKADAGLKRLLSEYGAPKFTWQNLRQTTATYLVNAAGIFGSATIYRSCAQLGHSVQVAERLYVGLMRHIPREARSLEAATQIEAQLKTIIDGHAQAAPGLRVVGA
jgi:integrase